MTDTQNTLNAIKAGTAHAVSTAGHLANPIAVKAIAQMAATRAVTTYRDSMKCVYDHDKTRVTKCHVCGKWRIHDSDCEECNIVCEHCGSDGMQD